MAELETPSYGYSLEAVVIDYEIFRLVSAMAASRVIAGLAHDSPNEPAWPWLRKAEFPEICRLLIGVAAIVRNSLDLGGDDAVQGAQRCVGELSYKDEPSKTVELTLREACNKVLHSSHVHPDIEEEDGPHKGSFLPLLHLYGAHGSREWKATLRIYDFAAAAWSNT